MTAADRRRLRSLLCAGEKVASVGAVLSVGKPNVSRLAQSIGMQRVWTTAPERELITALRAGAPASLQAEDPEASIEFLGTVQRLLRSYAENERS